MSMVTKIVKEKTDKYETQISYLQGVVDSLVLKIHDLEYHQDNLEQYSRRDSLRIVNNWPEIRGENTDNHVVKLVNEQLKIDTRPEEIARSHRVGPRRINKKPRPVIVKFISHNTKEKIYRARGRSAFNEETEHFYINEDLTNIRNKMYQQARTLKKENMITDCWTMDGTIFIKEKNLKIRTFQDPEKLFHFIKEIREHPPKLYSSIVQLPEEK